jgi:hypothetical protein
MGLSLILTSSVVYVPVARELFEFTEISASEYLLSMSLAIMVIPLTEAVKAVQKRRQKAS